MMNETTLAGKWKEIKGEIQTTWGRLTSDELEQAKGNLNSIMGLIQQKYGQAKEEVAYKLNEIATKLLEGAAETEERLKTAAAETTEEAKQALRKERPAEVIH